MSAKVIRLRDAGDLRRLWSRSAGSHSRLVGRRGTLSQRPDVSNDGSGRRGDVTGTSPLAGLSSKRMKGLEPSTFCMASRHLKASLPQILGNTSVYRASEGG